MNVTISECQDDRKEWMYSPRTTDQTEAVNRAVKKYFGKNASFHADLGLVDSGIYGQIIEPMRNDKNAYKCITGRVRIDIS